jgi:hypothetical protein
MKRYVQLETSNVGLIRNKVHVLRIPVANFGINSLGP